MFPPLCPSDRLCCKDQNTGSGDRQQGREIQGDREARRQQERLEQPQSGGSTWSPTDRERSPPQENIPRDGPWPSRGGAGSSPPATQPSKRPDDDPRARPPCGLRESSEAGEPEGTCSEAGCGEMRPPPSRCSASSSRSRESANQPLEPPPSRGPD